jgi:hypothetical protein
MRDDIDCMPRAMMTSVISAGSAANALVTLLRSESVKTDSTGETDLASNTEFLTRVFGNDLPEARPVVVSFAGNPAIEIGRAHV